MFTLSIVFFFIAFIFGLSAVNAKRSSSTEQAAHVKTFLMMMLMPLIFGACLLAGASTYTQEAGEAKVISTESNPVVDVTMTAGTHLKAPWAYVTTYDLSTITFSYDGPGSVSDEEAIAMMHAYTAPAHVPGFLDYNPFKMAAILGLVGASISLGLSMLRSSRETSTANDSAPVVIHNLT